MSRNVSASGERRPGRARDCRGAAALEFALVLSALAALLLGTVTTGYSYSHAIGVTNAVREGARFGATADETSATWAADVVARVRATEFDDPPSQTAICVSLFKLGTGTLKQACDLGTDGLTLTYPNAATDVPQVPTSGLAAGDCVVRVVAARKFHITLVVWPAIDRVLTRGSVARYERAC